MKRIKNQIQVGDLVTVDDLPDATVFEVIEVNAPWCLLIDSARKGMKQRPQEFFTELLTIKTAD